MSAPDLLDRYLGDLASYSLLDREQELSLAREIEEREIDHWAALLSSAAAYETVERALGPHFEAPDALRTLRRARKAPAQPAIQRAAEALREVDVSRVALADVHAHTRAALAGQPEQRAYLARIDAALRAQQEPKHRLVTANLRLVVALARRYTQGLLPLSDLVQEGNLGLLRAVDRFDHRRGLRFSTYAVWWIRHAFNRALSDRGRLVRVPVHALEDAQRIARASRALFARTGRSATVEELAHETELPVERVTPFIERAVGRDPLSLDRPLGEDGEATMLDAMPADSLDPAVMMDSVAWHGGIERLLGELTSIEADILRYRFGLDDDQELTLREIGEKYQLSRERIRQLQEQALGKLRRALVESRAAGDEHAA